MDELLRYNERYQYPLYEDWNINPYHHNIGVLSDLHIDFNPEVTPKKVMDLCTEKDVKLLFIAGDVSREVSEVIAFLNALSERLSVVYVLGNHELFNQYTYEECVDYLKENLSENITLLADDMCYLSFHHGTPYVSKEESRDSVRVYGSLAWDGDTKYIVSKFMDVSTIPRNEYVKLPVSNKPTIMLTHYPTQFTHPDIIMYIHGHTHRNVSGTYEGKPVISEYQVGRENSEIKMHILNKSEVVCVDIDRMPSPCVLTWEQYCRWYLANSYSVTTIKSDATKYNEVYCVHAGGYYMFFVKCKIRKRKKNEVHGEYALLRGGVATTVSESLEYYHAMLERYGDACRQMIQYSGFNRRISEISSAVRGFGGTGKTHGCIVDIDFCHHVFIHPKTGNVYGTRLIML